MFLPFKVKILFKNPVIKVHLTGCGVDNNYTGVNNHSYKTDGMA